MRGTVILCKALLFLLDQKVSIIENEKNVSKIDNSTFNAANANLECSVCLRIMAHSHSIVPCGHSFCYECLADVAKVLTRNDCKCPLCRKKFKIADVIPNRSTEAIIEEVRSEYVRAYSNQCIHTLSFILIFGYQIDRSRQINPD
jgi:late competence protein required for DNA uptake (superfamily II DNA/RNA helicase)